MQSRLGNLLSRHGDAAGSIASAFAMQGFLVVSGVIAARALGVENRGHFALLTITPVVMAQVATLGLPLAVTYFIAHERVDPRRVLRSLWPWIAGLTGAMVAIHAAILLVALRGQEQDVIWAGAATLLVAPGIVAQLFGLAVLQASSAFLSSTWRARCTCFSTAWFWPFSSSEASPPYLLRSFLGRSRCSSRALSSWVSPLGGGLKVTRASRPDHNPRRKPSVSACVVSEATSRRLRRFGPTN
jgi:hypothetical protein